MKAKKIKNHKIFKSRILDGGTIEITQHPTPKKDAFGNTFSGLFRFKTEDIFELNNVINKTIKNL